ncbi:MAG TPA: type II toxin-antitoxin system VapC family toxin [Candidatus Moranbacteria bacterium]|nr:type II toxin-antitoxin system VapC family toxin [Candidatus Moranbacteria bacterium]
MNKIYLDTNIFVSYYSDEDSNRKQKEAVIAAFKVFEQLGDVELWTSMWTITEMVKVLIRNIKMDPEIVSEIEKELLNESRLLNLKIRFADVSPIKDYDFKEFFYHIRNGILNYNSGVGDVMHSIIMKNNDIKHILTFDGKDDFKKIPELTVINPKDVKLDK